jgi:uncharacterized tellurite resistance protein B-like protein
MARIFETRWICEPKPSGRIHCRHCGEERDARRVTLHPWLAMFGKNLARIGRPREYGACLTCGRVYATDATPVDDSHDAFSEDERALLAVVAAVIFSDSRVRSAEKLAAREVIRRMTGLDFGPADLDGLLRSARTRWGDPVDRLERVAHLLDDAAKRRILEAAYLVSTGDRELHTQEAHLLNRIGQTLDLTPREVRRVIQRATLS